MRKCRDFRPACSLSAVILTVMLSAPVHAFKPSIGADAAAAAAAASRAAKKLDLPDVNVNPNRSAQRPPPVYDKVPQRPPPVYDKVPQRAPPVYDKVPRNPPSASQYGKAPPPASYYDRAPPPASHYGKAPPPASPYGKAPPPASPYGKAPPPASQYGKAPPPASYYDRAPSPAVYDKVPPPGWVRGIGGDGRTIYLPPAPAVTKQAPNINSGGGPAINKSQYGPLPPLPNVPPSRRTNAYGPAPAVPAATSKPGFIQRHKGKIGAATATTVIGGAGYVAADENAQQVIVNGVNSLAAPTE